MWPCVVANAGWQDCHSFLVLMHAGNSVLEPSVTVRSMFFYLFIVLIFISGNLYVVRFMFNSAFCFVCN